MKKKRKKSELLDKREACLILTIYIRFSFSYFFYFGGDLELRVRTVGVNTLELVYQVSVCMYIR